MRKWRVLCLLSVPLPVRQTSWPCTLSALPMLLCGAHAAADSPFATAVVSFVPGVGGVAGFSNPATALGSPERFSGEGLVPGCVTPFQPAFRPNELVSLGVGGRLVVAFDHDVIDDPRNPFGIDLLVFGNAFFTDSSFGFGTVAGLAAEGGTIAVSDDGIAWTIVPALAADGLFPTLGYLDVEPYAVAAGIVESDFLRPVDPTITMGDLSGLDYPAVLERYDGSGGGAGVDLGALGLKRVRYVRIEGPSVSGLTPEIDAFADVAPLSPDADLDHDGVVDATDLALLLAAWGSDNLAVDLDGDGAIGASDLALLLGAWGSNGGGA